MSDIEYESSMHSAIEQTLSSIIEYESTQWKGGSVNEM